MSCGAPKASEIPELAVIKDLHLRCVSLCFLAAFDWSCCHVLEHLDLTMRCFVPIRTVDELGLDSSIVSGMLLFPPLCSVRLSYSSCSIRNVFVSHTKGHRSFLCAEVFSP